MAVTRGLKNFQSKIDEPYGEGGGKTRYFAIKDKQTATVWFLDDLDAGSPAVEAGAGIAAHVTEHKAGSNFKRRAQCTMDDEGRCFGCEMAIAHPKTQWGKTGRVYVNVLVDDGKEDPYIAVWSIAVNNNLAWDKLLETYIDDGSIADHPWKVRRSGESTKTKWSVKMLKDEEQADFSAWDEAKYDLDTVTVTVPYEKQAAHYGNPVGAEPESEAPEQDAPTEEW